MSSIPSSIVEVTISRNTTAVTQAGFGIPGIISEFATSVTTVPFDRYAYYASLAEMAAAGWSTSSKEYLAASAIFAQNPHPAQVLIGRKASTDTSWADAFNAVQAAQEDWYSFSIIPKAQGKMVFSADLSASNQVAVTLNTFSITPVSFSLSHLNTANLVITAIESALADSDASLDATDTTNRTILVDKFATDIDITTATVTGGSAVTITKTNTNDSDLKAAMAWAETQTKLFFASTNDVNAWDAVATSDVGYFAKNAAYTRTVNFFHTTANTYIEEAMQGEEMPFDPGESTFCYKTLAGISADVLTTTKINALLDKNYNIYNTVGGVNITRDGLAASGENIDIIRNLDYLNSLIQTTIFANFLNNRKIPYDDSGIASIVALLQGALAQAAREGILQESSIVVTAPKYADISSLNKTNRNLPDITFTALLLGAIRSVEISGTVTV